MRYVMFRDVQNQWRWHLEGANNRIVASSGEGYYHKADCLAAIQLVKNSANVPVVER